MGTIKTYNELYLDLRRQLKAAGVEDINFEARLIVSAAAQKSKEEFTRDLKLYAPEETVRKATALCERRAAGEPLAYVLQEWEFMGLPMHVEPGVLIPRMDTEVLAELAVRLLGGEEIKNDVRILDLCCGSGCIGIALAARFPQHRVILVDNSMKALRLSRTNVLRNKVTRNATVIEADAMKAPPMLLGRFDLIVCNPPYVPTAEIGTLDSSVRDYEPREALDGGEDGLAFYRAIIPAWKRVLREKGCMLFECGEGQADTVRDLMSREGFTNTATYRDTAGTERVVAGIL